MNKNNIKIPNLKLKRSWIITIILTCCTVSLGIWAWQTSLNNRTYTIHSVSGEEAIQWAKRAKEDKWVEIVELAWEEKHTLDESSNMLRQKMYYRSIPKRKIDDYIRVKESVFVRQWTLRKKAANQMNMLDKAGFSNAGKMAEKISNEASKQDRNALLLTVGFLICLLVTLRYGIITIRQSKINNSKNMNK